jgi:hypothetical protein
MIGAARQKGRGERAKRRRGRLAPLLAALVLPALPAAAAAEGFAPGAWSHETRMISAQVPGVPQWVIKLFAGDRTRKSCYTAGQAATRPEALFTQDDAAVCRTRRFSMAEGRFVYDTFCTNKRFPEGLLVASKGSYTADSYEISTLSTGTKHGKPVMIVTTGSGHRTGGTCR